MTNLSRATWCLFGCLVTMIAFLASSALVPDKLSNAVEWLASNSAAGQMRAIEREENTRGLTEMVVDAVGLSGIDYQPVVILRQKGEELYLPISIGLLEATAISVVLEGIEVPRPLTADLFYSALTRMGASVDRVVVNDLKDHTFHATIVVENNWTRMVIDARPSDAIAIALRASTPIYVEKAVLDKAAIKGGQPKTT